uniref:Uncharacterized protein n=1 Tax=Aegilops tauschii subsp. strangulata TaxID=200361 RepID=A0A453IIL0_AEGTS
NQTSRAPFPVPMGSSSPSPSPEPPQSSAPAGGASNASLRWHILRRALLSRSASPHASEGTSNEPQEKGDTNKISRKTSRGFNLIECHTVPISQLNKSQGGSLNGNENGVECQRDVYVCYKLPCGGSPELNVIYRRDDSLELNDIEASNRFNIDTTGLVVGRLKRSLPSTVSTVQICSDCITCLSNLSCSCSSKLHRYSTCPEPGSEDFNPQF